MTTIVDNVDLVKYGFDNFPALWKEQEVRPTVYKLLETYLQFIQKFSDDVTSWANGATITNSKGLVLEEIWGELYNEAKSGRNDDDYRIAILNKMYASNDSGTKPAIKALARVLAGASYSTVSTYSNTRFCITRVEGGLLDSRGSLALNAAITSGGRTHTQSDLLSECLVPSVYFSSTPSPTLDVILPGPINDPLSIILPNGNTDDLLVSTTLLTNPQRVFPVRELRSFLYRTVEDSSVSGTNIVPLEGITSTGVLPFEGRIETASGTALVPIEAGSSSGTSAAEGWLPGRFLAISNFTKIS